jgi:hypothetical protein
MVCVLRSWYLFHTFLVGDMEIDIYALGELMAKIG